MRALVLALGLALGPGAPAARADFDVVQVTSPGGIEAWLYEAHDIPIVTIDATFLGGPALDPESRQGRPR